MESCRRQVERERERDNVPQTPLLTLKKTLPCTNNNDIVIAPIYMVGYLLLFHRGIVSLFLKSEGGSHTFIRAS